MRWKGPRWRPCRGSHAGGAVLGAGTVGFAANRRVLKKGKWVGFGVNPNGPVDPACRC